MEIILELAKFNDVKYFDGPHKYYVGDKEYVSATTFIKKFKKEFETQRLAETYAAKRGLTVESVLGDWDLKRDISTVKGTLVHNMANHFHMTHQTLLKLLDMILLKKGIKNVRQCFTNFIKMQRKT